jgi:hypothetical protein
MKGGVSPLTSSENDPSPAVVVVRTSAGAEESFSETVPATTGTPEAAMPDTVWGAGFEVLVESELLPHPVSTRPSVTAEDKNSITKLFFIFRSPFENERCAVPARGLLSTVVISVAATFGKLLPEGRFLSLSVSATAISCDWLQTGRM